MQILTNALLGIDKMPLQSNILPPKIAEYLEKYTADSPEASFLMAATLLNAYESAGEMPQKLVVQSYKPAPEETREYCPDSLLAYFDEKKDSFQVHLMAFALDKCLKNNWTVSPNGLILLLNLGKNKNLPLDIKQKIAQVLGEKGAWLASFNPEWSSFALLETAEIAETAWTEGNTEQRLAIFTAMRHGNAKKAMLLFKNDWVQCSARERKSFLEAMKINLNAGDEAFLETVYTDILAQKDSDKGLKGEMKKQVIDLLLALPDSKKQTEIFDKMTAYFTRNTAFLGLKSTGFSLKLPDAEDDFFNVKTMNGLLGRSKTNPILDLCSDAEFWFQDLLSFIPPQKWAIFLNKNTEETIGFFGEKMMSSIKKNYAFALAALGDAIVLHEEKDLAFAYLKESKTTIQNRKTVEVNPALYSLLSPIELDRILKIGQQNLEYEQMIQYFPKQNWGQITSECVLLAASDFIKNNYYNQNKKGIIAVFPYLHPASLDSLQKHIESLQNNYEKDHIDKYLLQPFRYFLEAKRAILI